MAKGSNLAEAPFSLHYAQTFLGKKRKKIITDDSLIKLDYVNIKELGVAFIMDDTKGESDFQPEKTIIVKVFDICIHCYFGKDDCCNWVAIYIDENNLELITQYRKLVRNYQSVPHEKDSWVHYQFNSLISLFHDNENSRYILAFIPYYGPELIWNDKSRPFCNQSMN